MQDETEGLFLRNAGGIAGDRTQKEAVGSAHLLKEAVDNLEETASWEAAARLEDIGCSGVLDEAQPVLCRLEKAIEQLTDRLARLKEGLTEA